MACPCGKKILVPNENARKKKEPGLFSLRALIISVIAIASLLSALVYANKTYQKHAFEAKAALLLNEAQQAQAGGQHKIAYKKYLELGKLKPKWAVPHFEAALLAMRLNKKSKTKRLRAALKLPGMTPAQKSIIHTDLGLLALAKKKPAKNTARKHLKAALKLRPKMLRPQLMLASLDFLAGDLKGTVAHLAVVEKNQPALATIKGAEKIYRLLKLRLAFKQKDKEAWLREYPLARKEDTSAAFAEETSRMALEFIIADPKTELKKDHALFALSEKCVANLKDNILAETAHAAIAKLYYRAKQYDQALASLKKVSVHRGTPSACEKMRLAIYIARAKAEKDAKKKAALHKTVLKTYRQFIAKKGLFKPERKKWLLAAMGYCDQNKLKKNADELLTMGLKTCPDLLPLLRRAGYLKFQEAANLAKKKPPASTEKQSKIYREGRAFMEKALALDPGQKDLAAELESFKKPPLIDQFRASAPNRTQARPLIHLRITNGAPFPILPSSIKITLDGKVVKPKKGGSEYFYPQTQDLSPGVHTVVATAADLVGNTATKKFTFPVDLTPPQAKLLAPIGAADSEMPLVTISIFDKLTSVDPTTLAVQVHNAKDSPVYSQKIIQDGVFVIANKKLHYKKGTPVADLSKISFRLLHPLRTGIYEVRVQVQDVRGNKGSLVLTFPFDEDAQ